ncbi:ATP phosphoribosyltransferase [Parafilimonas terrae]|uniref:ATP phosphoribosyltransferase n=1 Tax=Parafilimonas terrae TaxID=1465490 RepID=A0A1I5SJM2_9BACT|nr:ATP phosphoribosyltransferase [Parafilimonas terrae]SFP70707.1 ATP phosphoribosyltransferase [Parafilimonas terrae]
METKLKIALQKSGRLYDDSVKILKECGIELQNGMNKLLNEAINFPMQILFLRDDDIPQYVEDGVADIGIVGENIVYETNKNVEIIEKLGFGKCRLSVAVPRNENYADAQFLNGKRIATTYPFLLQSFLDKNKVTAEIHEISGSVEITPGVGLADAICDLVSSGSTLFSNGLKETEVVLNSQAALIGNKDLSSEKQLLLKKLLFRIQAVKKAKKNKYILLNAPNDKLDIICSLIPGMKSPTILPLGIEGWSSLHSVVQEDDFWNIIESLKDNGAEGILIIPIEKMVL